MKLTKLLQATNITRDQALTEIKYDMINIEFDTRDGRSYFDM